MKHRLLFTILSICGSGLLLTSVISWKSKTREANAAAIQSSVIKSFSLLQTSGAKFIMKAKCASCHHATLTSMIAEKLKDKGIAGVDTTAGMRVFAMTKTLEFVSNPNINSQFVSAKFLAPYNLLGLNAEKYPADFNTDIAVDYVISQALPDGSFKAEYARVPLEMGDIHLTAFAIRAIQLFASPAKKAQTEKLVANSKKWLEKQKPAMQQELVFQLLGMQWCGSSKDQKTAVAQGLISMQNKDGGWSQLPTMQSDAYATGQALYALSESGAISTANEVYVNGVNYLLKTQDASGAWLVVTRSNPIQPFISSNFPPYDENQFISAAATNWATLALVEALPDKK